MLYYYIDLDITKKRAVTINPIFKAINDNDLESLKKCLFETDNLFNIRVDTMPEHVSIPRKGNTSLNIAGYAILFANIPNILQNA